ncbi:MAG TPA: BON domain-containing protein [Gemmatimonadaceae bacterium]|nr:BON domain-containing protein [Gemmatimonadaceae bacterium]
MKTDSQLQRDVIDELTSDPRVGNAEIGVSVKDGVVTLTGFVDTYARKIAAEQAVERLGGVRAVAEDLKVRLPGAFERSDTDIAHQVANALRWDIEVPDDRLKARVENGWVWLEGQVEWQYQRMAAERAVRYLTGVKGVTNLVKIATRASTYDVSKRIKEALHRSVEEDAKKIQVETADGHVTLRGSVRSFAARQDAERAAWAAEGVTAVDDRIVVTTP